MADLTGIESSQSVKIVGQNSSGVETYPVGADAQGNVHSKLRDASGNDLGTITNPIFTTPVGNTAIGVRVYSRVSLAAQTLRYIETTFSADTALTEMHVGGRVACEATVSKYVAATNELVPSGGFNSSGDVSTWTNTGIGDSAIPSWSYATDQFIAGTGSAKFTFTKSAATDYPEITYTWSTPQDLTEWRYIKAAARVTVASGGSQSRTIQIRLTSGTAVRIYSITGTTTTAPFSTEQWHYITGDIGIPTSTAGSGTFDRTQINSISLRLVDGGNKTGTIWWDDVRLMGHIDIEDKLYSGDGSTITEFFNPSILFNSGETLLVILRNNGSVTAELEGGVGGYEL